MSTGSEGDARVTAARTRKVKHNYLPGQYDRTGEPRINHNYLVKQFADYRAIFRKMEKLVRKADYTLGRHVDEFENNIRRITGARFAIGVGSGTEALFLSLKAAGIGPGDEVITTPYTFVATIGAIATTGARPVFVDIRQDYNINPSLIAAAVTPRTKAILPVHWSGLPCEMDAIMKAARAHKLAVIEDSCHAIKAFYKGRHAGRFGLAGCFSLHPLKNLNVWGDGGYIITDSPRMHEKLVLMRNHGLVDRNECIEFAYNSRLDSIQAIVANHLLRKLGGITASRIANAARYDRGLAGVKGITIPRRPAGITQVYHIYVLRAERRDELQRFLVAHGVDAKVHYPVPMHLQPAARKYGYRRGDFPVCEAVCDSVISLPVHEFITASDVDYVVGRIREFYDARQVR